MTSVALSAGEHRRTVRSVRLHVLERWRDVATDTDTSRDELARARVSGPSDSRGDQDETHDIESLRLIDQQRQRRNRAIVQRDINHF